MTTSSDQHRRGYFNALTSGYFKTGADGRKLFFPWGIFGSGYAIPSDAALRTACIASSRSTCRHRWC